MKCLFVYTLENIISIDKPLDSFENINFGIFYLSSVLKQHGHETRLAILGSSRPKPSIEQLRKVLAEFRPDIVAFSAVATQYPFVKELASDVRQRHPEGCLIIGGAHATLCPEQVMEGPFDAVCIGEGEYALLELANCLANGQKPHDIQNLWFRSETGIIRNPTRPFMQNLDELPFPDRDIWLEWIQARSNARFSILLGRGCPFTCTYCSNHALRQKASGAYVRFRSPDNILEELRYLQSRFPDKREYFFEVETFNVNHAWVSDLCAKLIAFNASLEKKLTFGTNVRITPNADFDKFFSECSRADIRLFTVGLESGCERIRTQIMRRHYSNADVLNMARMARKHGCRFGFQNLIGLPTETEQEFMETVKLNRECRPDWLNLNVFYPYPGTELAETAKRMGLMKDTAPTQSERRTPALVLPTFPLPRLRKRFNWFMYDVFRDRTPRYKLLGSVLIVKMLSIPRLRDFLYFFKRLALTQRIIAAISQ